MNNSCIIAKFKQATNEHNLCNLQLAASEKSSYYLAECLRSCASTAFGKTHFYDAL